MAKKGNANNNNNNNRNSGGGNKRAAAPAAPAPANNMKIAQDVIANPGNYDTGYSREVASQNPSSVIYQGLYGGGLSDGEGGTHRLQGFYVPGATNGIGPNKDVLFAAGPGANQEWMNANFGVGGRYYGGPLAGAPAAAAAGTSSPAAQQSTARSIADAENLRQAIKIAAANGQGGLIDRRETNQIFDQFGDKKNLNDMKFAGILDKVNANQTSKGKKSKQLIGMSGGALNLLNSGKLGPTGFLPYSTFGTTDKYGGLSGVLRNMGTTGKFGRTDSIYGQYSTGQFKDSPGLGKSWADTRFGKPMVSTGTTDGEVLPGGGTPGGDTAAGDTASPMTPEQMSAASTMGANQYGAGADLMSFANSWKPRQSSRRKAGKNAQGFASQRTSPYNAYGISTNVG